MYIFNHKADKICASKLSDEWPKQKIVSKRTERTTTQKLYENTQDTTKRKLAEAVPVDNIKIQDIYDIWVAPHELKDYGDSDELIYRKFFREGYIRIELHIPDVNGCVGKKIFYIPDIECLPSEKNESSILVSQKDWREYNS